MNRAKKLLALEAALLVVAGDAEARVVGDAAEFVVEEEAAEVEAVDHAEDVKEFLSQNHYFLWVSLTDLCLKKFKKKFSFLLPFFHSIFVVKLSNVIYALFLINRL